MLIDSLTYRRFPLRTFAIGGPMHSLPWTDVLLRLVVATVLGGLVGLERERLDRAAGLRTHILVAIASCLVMIVSAFGFADALTADGTVSLDPSRVAAQVVSGIGFLGAGVIIFRKNTVRGLTTAASIWAVAGIGLAAGGGLFAGAAIGTALILIVQAGIRPLERRFFAHPQEHRLELRVQRGARRLLAVEQVIAAGGIELRGLRLRPAREGAEDRVDLDLGVARAGAVPTLLEALRGLEGVRVVTYTRAVPRVVAPGGAEEVEAAEEEGRAAAGGRDY
jgi:putative Mg2+ transporter-C (MgtC) family protein